MIPSRTDIDTEVATFFPNGSGSRKELPHGFSDTIRVGFLSAVIEVYEQGNRRKPAESIVTSIQGTRLLDGSKVIMWSKVTIINSRSDLSSAFLELQKTLVGIAAAILMATGDPPPKALNVWDRFS